MKKLLLLATILLSINAFSQIPSYVPTSGLVGWYPFNGNANDLSGNGNNLTNNNSVTFSADRFSLSSSSANFNGINQTLSKTNPSIFSGNSDRTISFWINQSGTITGQSSLININNGANGQCYTSSSIEVESSLSGNFLFWRRCDDAGWAFNRSLNVWYHVVLTYSNNTVKLYLNNTLLNTSSSISGITNTIPSNLIIGGGLTNNNNNIFWKGKIDDIGMWNRVLTNQEVSQLYTGCNMSIASISPSGSTTFCQGNSVLLNSNLQGSLFSYTWVQSGTAITGANSSTYSATQGGSYTLKVDSGGCSVTSAPLVVTVNPIPSVSITELPITTNIKITSISLSGAPSGGTFTGQGVTGSSFSPSAANLGTKKITYTYTNINGCINSASTSTIVYDTVGCSEYIANISLLQSDTSLKGISIRQLQTDSIISRNSISFLKSDTTSKGITIRQLQTDLANKHDTVYMASDITGDTLKISIHTGISSTSPVLNSLKVYPNPASTILNIVLEKAGYYTATMTGVTGQTIITPTSGTIDISGLANGIYTLTIMDSKGKTISVNKVSVLK